MFPPGFPRVERHGWRMEARRLTVLSLTTVGLILSGCLGDGGGPTGGDEEEIPEAVVATFRVEGETFKVWITRGSTIVDLYVLLNGSSTKTVPTGPLLPGPGEGDHNLPWSWHLDPQLTRMETAPGEGCSATPSAVEADLAAWLAGGHYCPGNAVLVSLVAGSPS